MHWFFRGSLSLKTPLSLLEVYSCLVKLIAKEDSDEVFKKKYVGTVYENGFTLKKPYKQVLPPPHYSCTFTGEVTPYDDGTLIKINIGLDKSIRPFIWASISIFLILVINTIIPFSALPPLDAEWSIVWLTLGSILYFGNLILFNGQCKNISRELVADLNGKKF
jgi:hypothetical protein